MKKSIKILALSILLCGCKRQEYLPTISPTYEYRVNEEKQYNLGSISCAVIDTSTNDTLLLLIDDQNKKASLQIRFNNQKVETTLAYNDTVYFSDVVAFHYRTENGKLYGLFSFNGFNGFKSVEVTKGRFNDISIVK